MFLDTVCSGFTGVARCQKDLKRAIEKKLEVKQLYKRHYHLNAMMPHRSIFEDVLAVGHPPQLRIKGSPVPARQSHYAVSQPPPLSDMGSSESISFTITLERRRLHPQIISKNIGGCTALLEERLKLTQSRPSPSKEFAARLSRLQKASAFASATAREAKSVGTNKAPLSDSLAISPIIAESPAAQDDVSVMSYASDIPALFGDVGEVSVPGRGRVEGVRHVRFSSRSPQVATFSVERSCVPLEKGSNAMAVAGAAAPRTPVTEMEKRAPDPPLGLMERAHSAPLDTSAQRVSTPATSSFVSLGSSTAVSPRTSVSSYLAQVKELRNSLLEAPSCTRHNGHLVDDNCYLREQQPIQDSGRAKWASVMDWQVENEGAATPSKKCMLEGTRDLGDSVGAAALGIHSSTTSGALGLTAAVIDGASPTPVISEMSECFKENSPLFLRRPERRGGTHIPNSDDPSFFRNIANQQQTACTPAPSTVWMSPETTIASIHKPMKKCVRFRESVERSGKGNAVTTCKRRRSGWPPTSSSASSSTVAGVPIVMPTEWSCEQEGFGAGILLACGPTLYFD
ncbi:hypothetical protein, conserved [Leishmania tarentolae]|uniref:Uncharacterized protein n=1 Tax=Leishmania tarentolae TaxID=5689 RepID=A0A640KPB9_LEITA|nr:hypothetical protein, conserved [Leishmania tarentolae]